MPGVLVLQGQNVDRPRPVHLDFGSQNGLALSGQCISRVSSETAFAPFAKPRRKSLAFSYLFSCGFLARSSQTLESWHKRHKIAALNNSIGSGRTDRNP
ncbi:hypothetical protein BPAE_0092g00210 [Botrytis paeoniae]|uniref:Uncharacterized protein n=1 Tax=Botrytis paeoniae TaxID=278948 RepID=A0A4Z1FPX8_9HELO|nr:hypothetical protein BPAE_0092g00210 [Botrytis paeoniae]